MCNFTKKKICSFIAKSAFTNINFTFTMLTLYNSFNTTPNFRFCVTFIYFPN